MDSIYEQLERTTPMYSSLEVALFSFLNNYSRNTNVCTYIREKIEEMEA